jgi:hypothetical protein
MSEEKKETFEIDVNLDRMNLGFIVKKLKCELYNYGFFFIVRVSIKKVNVIYDSEIQSIFKIVDEYLIKNNIQLKQDGFFIDFQDHELNLHYQLGDGYGK